MLLAGQLVAGLGRSGGLARVARGTVLARALPCIPFTVGRAGVTQSMRAMSAQPSSKAKSLEVELDADRFGTELRICGQHATAVVFGGFGFSERQIAKHAAIYEQHEFTVLPIVSKTVDLMTPLQCDRRGRELAAQLEAADRDVVLHTVSGSFWTMICTLVHLSPSWRERRVRAIMFDSCPPEDDIYAFGGWVAWLLQAKLGIPAASSKPYISPLFHPIRWGLGITAAFTTKTVSWMRGDGCVVPKSAVCLFIRGVNDPVLRPSYIDDWADYLKARTSAHVESRLIERAQHAMAVVEAPEVYKAAHVGSLLAMVPEWVEVVNADGSSSAHQAAEASA